MYGSKYYFTLLSHESFCFYDLINSRQNSEINKFQRKMASPDEIQIPDESETESDRCTEHNCIKDMIIKWGFNVINVSEHYACTGPPPYQLNMFLNRGYRKYLCITCCSPAKDLGRKKHTNKQKESRAVRRVEKKSNLRKNHPNQEWEREEIKHGSQRFPGKVSGIKLSFPSWKQNWQPKSKNQLMPKL